MIRHTNRKSHAHEYVGMAHAMNPQGRHPGARLYRLLLVSSLPVTGTLSRQWANDNSANEVPYAWW